MYSDDTVEGPRAPALKLTSSLTKGKAGKEREGGRERGRKGEREEGRESERDSDAAENDEEALVSLDMAVDATLPQSIEVGRGFHTMPARGAGRARVDGNAPYNLHREKGGG